ncbi:cold-shock protein [Acidocella sp. MX-AZ02]|uniref:cold-shock protein n=2 Tax=Acidocellaceae TaxID=3385905 RepID=UPI000A00F992|nr:cold shock domain-containing protein [Acidocella sp. MX-AZ02]
MVKWTNLQKSLGFIMLDDKSEDVFVHVFVVERSGLDHWNDGQKITYHLEDSQYGKVSAINSQVT